MARRAIPSTDGSVHLETFPEVPQAWRDEAARRALGEDAPGAPGRHRRARDRARAETHRLEPRGGAGGLSSPTTELVRRPRRASTSPRSASPRSIDVRRGEGPADAFRLDEVRGVAVVPALRRGPQMRPLVEDLARGRRRSRLSGRDAARRRGAARMGRARGPHDHSRPASARILALATLALDQASKLYLLFGYDLPLREPVRPRALPRPDRGLEPGHLLRPLPAGHRARPLGASSPSSIGAAVGLSVWMARATSRLLAASLGLIVGGAIGNAIDRVAYGAVFDFVHFHVGSLLLVRLQRGRRRHRCGRRRAPL